MGTEEFWVPAVMAAVSAGGQAYAQNQAQSRQNAADVQGIINQQQLANKAGGDVTKLTQQIATDTPQKIQAKATGDYVRQLRTNAAGSQSGGSTSADPNLFGQSTSSTGPVSGADPRFAKDLASGQAEVGQYGDRVAKEMGGMDAAVRMRQNEGLDMGSLATQLGLLDAQSYGQNFVDSLRAQAGGQMNPWAVLGAQLLGRGAQAMATNGFGGGKTTTSVTPKLQTGGSYYDTSGLA